MKVISNDKDKCERALLALKDVYDPEIGLNVVDLGLIYEISFSDEKLMVEIVMTLTSQFCPMGEAITNDVYHSLINVFKDHEVKVELVFDPPWDYRKISEEGRKFLQGY